VTTKIANGEEETKGPRPSEKSVIDFLRKNPRPTDDQFHEWARSRGLNVHKAEATAYGILSDLLTKGQSKGKAPAGVTREDVNRGVKIEAEHTPNKEIQRKITDDHNAELKNYYDKRQGLPAMEKALEKEGGIGRVLGRAKYRWEQMQKKREGRPISQVTRELEARQKKGTIVKPTGALRSKLGPIPKTASFLLGFIDELEKLGYNGAVATKRIRPGTPESKALRKELKARGVWKGKEPGLLQRAAHRLRRLTKPKPLSHLKVTKTRKAKPVETSKAIESALGGSLSSFPSIPGLSAESSAATRTLHKVGFVRGFVDELEKQGVTFGKKRGLWLKGRALKRKLLGPPQSQIERMNRKHWANVAAAEFGGSSKDLRAAAASKRMIGKGQALLDKRQRLVKLLTPHRAVGSAVKGWVKRNPDLAFAIAMPAALIGGSVGAAGLVRLMTPKRKKGLKKRAMDKEAGPPTLAKLRRAYPKGKVKVADPAAAPRKLLETRGQPRA
jgi:hypothetical protein